MDLRCYFIVNQYIAGIHAGIQGAHAMAEMFSKYRGKTNKAAAHLQDWVDKDKTIIVLEGGYASRLEYLHDLLLKVQGSYPCAKFHEEVDALNGALTAVAVVLPEYMYKPKKLESGEYARLWVDPKTCQVGHRYNKVELDVIEHLQSLRLKGV